MHRANIEDDAIDDIPEMKHPTFMTGREFRALLEETGAIGVWADRDDIGDTVEYARKLCEQAQTREHE